MIDHDEAGVFHAYDVALERHRTASVNSIACGNAFLLCRALFSPAVQERLGDLARGTSPLLGARGESHGAPKDLERSVLSQVRET